MKQTILPAPPGSRAARLQTQALNCLDLALTQKSSDDAARLIDEALMLTRRAEELVRPVAA